MQRHLSTSQRVFYVGLLLMLGSAMLSAAVSPSGMLAGMTLTGALLALLGRAAHEYLRRSALRLDHFGQNRLGSPTLLRHPNLKSARRVA